MRRLADDLRTHLAATAGAAFGLALIAWLGLADFAFNDYDTEASAAVRALTGGHIWRFVQTVPAYGGSLALRSPFALAPGLWGGGELATYRMLALPCLLSAGALAVWVAARMRAMGKPRLIQVAAVALLAANPVAMFALQIGHPEEILGGVLCVAAVLAARSGRTAWAGAMLGLAVANKSWAMLAVLPVLATLPHRRARVQALAIAGAVAGTVLAPFLIARQLGGAGAASGVGAGSGPIFEPAQLWWWLGSHGVVRGANGMVKPGFRLEPGWLATVAHPLIVALAIPLTLLWLRVRRGRALEPLALLTLLLLARCALDPWNNLYYAVPFLLALATWESLGTGQAPLLSLAATALCYVTWKELPGRVGPDVESFFYMSWVVPLGAAIGVWLYAPGVVDRLALRVTRQRGRLPDVDQILGEAA